MEKPDIIIRRDGAGFAVEVVPSQPGHPIRYFDNSRSAFGHAGGVRMVTGWRKVDLTVTP
ncbi:hypothetical protein [Novosphingobium sp.]|uniref:hypothetical protein n=1 Tax=Novosphingobium sp. TaxID=1874826 RepID=UPI00260F77FF|nr:hypothetical protein [Novosphingobium sp.]